MASSAARAASGIGADLRREVARQVADAFDALALRAEPGMEGDAEMVEAGHALVERLRRIEAEPFGRALELSEVGQIGLVGGPEIERVGEPRGDHLGVAVGDLGAAVAGLDIGGHDEAVRQRVRPALRAADEAFLVGADG